MYQALHTRPQHYLSSRQQYMPLHTYTVYKIIRSLWRD